MRVLTIGYPLPDPQIDNYDWGTAPSFFDYDVIVVDPYYGVSELIEGILREGSAPLTYSDEPIQDGPTTATSVGLADLLRRRRDDTERLLARGGLVVCFGYPDVPHTRVSGYPGAHRLYWLPAPLEKDYSTRRLKPANGISVNVTDYEHPFGDYLESARNLFSYRVLFAEGADGLGEDAKVMARSNGGAAVALDLKVGAGRIIFLPALRNNLTQQERAGVARDIVAAARNTLLLSVEEEPPEWLSEYPLPGVEEAQAQVEEAESRLEALEIELNEARNKLQEVDRFRRILWQEGKFGFDLPVRDAMKLLGFGSYSNADEPAVLSYEGETVFLECESSPNQVGMEPHYRLRQRLETRIAFDEKRVRGLIVINGHRELPPAERPQQYAGSLRVAAESMRYCVVEATTLFDVIRDNLEGRDRRAAFVRQLIETEGVLTTDAAPAETSEKTTT